MKTSLTTRVLHSLIPGFHEVRTALLVGPNGDVYGTAVCVICEREFPQHTDREMALHLKRMYDAAGPVLKAQLEAHELVKDLSKGS